MTQPIKPADPTPAASPRGEKVYAGSFGDDATLRPVAVAYRCLLDHVAALRYPHLERGVVEVAAIAATNRCGDGLEEPPVEAHRPTACTERQPVQVDRRHRGCGHPSYYLGSSGCLRSYAILATIDSYRSLFFHR